MQEKENLWKKGERGLGGWSAMGFFMAAAGHSVRVDVNWKTSKIREKEKQNAWKDKKKKPRH